MENMGLEIWILGGTFMSKMLLDIFGASVKKKWYHWWVIDRKIILIDKDSSTRDYAELCGPDGKWGPVEFVKKSLLKNKIVFYHITVVEDVAEFSRRVVDYETFKTFSKRAMSPEAIARLIEAIPTELRRNKEIKG